MAERPSTIPPQPSQARGSVRFSNANVFSDEFALEQLEITDDHDSPSLDRESRHAATLDTPRQSLSLQRALESPAGSVQRSRASQRSNARSSILSRFDDRTSQFSNPPRSVTPVSDLGNTASTQHQSVRTISTFGFPRAQSPYQGATGPSHSYGMYPQDIGLTRTPSTATTSTIRRPERSYSGPSGPTQPYGMYAQNTVPEDDADAGAGLVPPVGAGFSGPDRNFQRRLGPDGEDVDDLIGPDGYTEQLPPYSRYANGVPPKYTSGIGSISRRSAPPVQLVDSQETLHSSQTRDDGLINPFRDSSTQLASTTSVTVPPKDEGGNFKERVRRRGRKKVCCGITCWLCVVIFAVLFLAVLLGGLIGGVVAHQRGEQKGRQEALATVTAAAAAPTATVTMSTPPDALSLTATPSNLPSLPLGQYSVTLNEPTIVTNSCLTISGQQVAWDCATGAELTMDVSTLGPNAPQVSLSYPPPPNPAIRYGAQPPQLSGVANLMLMRDRDAFNKGPAYFFTQQYIKTVIVNNSDLPGGSPSSKRAFLRRWFFEDEDLEDSASLQERDTSSQWTSDSFAEPGDKPWYCFWNGTILEGFIFIQQNITGESASGTAGYASAAATSMAAASSAPYAAREKRQAPSNLQPYPNVVKIEERRNPHNPVQPYCQQMQILYNWQLNELRDPENQLIQIQLTENEPLVQHQMQQNQEAPGGPPSSPASPTGMPSRRRAVDKRDPTRNTPSCQCEWMST